VEISKQEYIAAVTAVSPMTFRNDVEPARL
jgi:hypothetical protein